MNRLEEAKKRKAERETIERERRQLVSSTPSPYRVLREQQLREIKQMVEGARKRNVSNAGLRYSPTYGFVIEPHDAKTWLGRRKGSR